MLNAVTARITATLACRKGVTALEYGVIAAGIVVVIMTAVIAIGGSLQGTFEAIQAALGGGGGGT